MRSPRTTGWGSKSTVSYTNSHKTSTAPTSNAKNVKGDVVQTQAKTANHPYEGPLQSTPLTQSPLHLLTDEQVRFFLFNGYIVLKTQLPVQFHEDIYMHMEAHPEHAGNASGNNILPHLPRLNQVYEDPNVKGALVSLLGHNYLMHPHRFCHAVPPGQASQKWHRDTFWGYGRNFRYNKPRYVMAMYYPQNTTPDMAPTGLKPGTQYYSIDPKYYKGDLQNHYSNDSEAQDFYGVVEAGSVILIHYDIIHKGSVNNSKRNRYMFKFQFIRMEEPERPTWNIASLKWNPGGFISQYWPLDPVCHSLWEWMSGQEPVITPLDKSEDLQHLTELLSSKEEWNRYYAHHRLARAGQHNLLVEQLQNNDHQIRTNATLALVCSTLLTKELMATLLSLLKRTGEDEKADGSEWGYPQLNQSIIFLLGQHGKSAVAALPVLLGYLRDRNPAVRATVCEAIGIIGSTIDVLPDGTIKEISLLLQDSEGKVRFQCALALALLGPKAEPAIDALTAALRDCNRYVQGYAVVALKQIGTPRALEVLVEYLMASRWCPLTSSKSPY